MEAKVICGDAAAEFDTAERCHIIEYSNSAQDPELSIARARVAPGVTTRWHRLQGTAERYHILSGEGVVEVGTLPETPVGLGDTVLIPPGCRQRITNTGQVDLIFWPSVRRVSARRITRMGRAACLIPLPKNQAPERQNNWRQNNFFGIRDSRCLVASSYHNSNKEQPASL